VHKHFGGIVVAEDISLEMRRGEILGLIGPNGAGKTTLFNLICGIHAPDAAKSTCVTGRLRGCRCTGARAWASRAPGSTCRSFRR
jgi:branched-chain amino acid transport system ATP-binding protein